MSLSGFCCCATAEEVTTQKVRNPPTPKLQKASGTLDFLFVSVCGLARKDAHTKCTTDSNVAQWLSLLRVITDEAVQSSIAWCAIAEEVTVPPSSKSVNTRSSRSKRIRLFFCLYADCGLVRKGCTQTKKRDILRCLFLSGS